MARCRKQTGHNSWRVRHQLRFSSPLSPACCILHAVLLLLQPAMSDESSRDDSEPPTTAPQSGEKPTTPPPVTTAQAVERNPPTMAPPPTQSQMERTHPPPRTMATTPAATTPPATPELKLTVPMSAPTRMVSETTRASARAADPPAQPTERVQPAVTASASPVFTRAAANVSTTMQRMEPPDTRKGNVQIEFIAYGGGGGLGLLVGFIVLVCLVRRGKRKKTGGQLNSRDMSQTNKTSDDSYASAFDLGAKPASKKQKNPNLLSTYDTHPTLNASVSMASVQSSGVINARSTTLLTGRLSAMSAHPDSNATPEPDYTVPDKVAKDKLGSSCSLNVSEPNYTLPKRAVKDVDTQSVPTYTMPQRLIKGGKTLSANTAGPEYASPAKPDVPQNGPPEVFEKEDDYVAPTSVNAAERNRSESTVHSVELDRAGSVYEAPPENRSDTTQGTKERSGSIVSCYEAPVTVGHSKKQSSLTRLKGSLSASESSLDDPYLQRRRCSQPVVPTCFEGDEYMCPKQGLNEHSEETSIASPHNDYLNPTELKKSDRPVAPLRTTSMASFAQPKSKVSAKSKVTRSTLSLQEPHLPQRTTSLLKSLTSNLSINRAGGKNEKNIFAEGVYDVTPSTSEFSIGQQPVTHAEGDYDNGKLVITPTLEQGASESRLFGQKTTLDSISSAGHAEGCYDNGLLKMSPTLEPGLSSRRSSGQASCADNTSMDRLYQAASTGNISEGVYDNQALNAFGLK